MKLIDDIFQIIKNGMLGLNKGFSSGSPKLDRYTGGVLRQRFTLLFGGTGSGKSSLALYSYVFRPIYDNPDAPIKVVYFSLEVSKELLMIKLLGLYIWEKYKVIIPFDKLMSIQEVLTDEEFKYVQESREWLESIAGKLVIYDGALNSRLYYKHTMQELGKIGTFTVTENDVKDALTGEMKKVKHKTYEYNNPNTTFLTIVDHLLLLQTSDGKSLKNEMDTISTYGVTLRNNYQISPVFIMQQNRSASNVERRKMELSEPGLDDAKESGGPGEAAEIVLALYNPYRDQLNKYGKYPIISIDNNCLKDRCRGVLVLKNRFGASGKRVILNFFGEVNYFRELPPASEITDYTPYKTLQIEKPTD